MVMRLIKLMGILTIMLLITSPALAAEQTLQTAPITSPAVNAARSDTYTNPLPVQIPGGGMVTSCADPTIIRGQTPGDNAWYMYCTTDPLNPDDKTGDNFNFNLIPMLRSTDLVNWTYMGNVFTERPAWVDPTSGLWAPEIEYFNNQYYLYFTVPDTAETTSGEPNCNSDSAIGVATSSSPLGPWTDHGAPVVYPRRNGAFCNFFWTYDPKVVHDGSQAYIFFGSYYGGVVARQLSADGFTSDPATQVQITIPNRYEGTEIVKHDGYWYLFGSATNCCNGPLTGYSIFAGRSQNLLGPYVDREGVSLLAGQVGGTPVISMNGNRWVGPGHNSVFQDFSGQWWTVYHAVDRGSPYFTPGFTRRPVLLDALDWVGGWPTVRGGLWASDTKQPVPAAQPGMTTKYKMKTPPLDQPQTLIPSLSDEFNGSALSPQWSWVREPQADTFSVSGGMFNFNTQAADLYVDSNNASVLTEATPTGNYILETKVKLNLPPEGCCFNYVQAGVVIYGGDDNFIKLATVSIWETRQTEYAKEEAPVPANYPRYGNTVIGAPGEWTYLRIVRRVNADGEQYTGYTSRDGVNWVRGGVWTHQLGSAAKIGLVSMGGSGFTANFEYVKVYTLSD